MSYSIEKVEGIGPAYAAQLKPAGITTTAALLRHCADRKGRKKTAEATGISEKRLLEWSNLADLMRIRGVGPQFSELLEAAGVDTVKELRNRNPSTLAVKLAEVHEQKRLTRIAPPPSKVAGWVAQAKKLAPVMSY